MKKKPRIRRSYSKSQPLEVPVVEPPVCGFSWDVLHKVMLATSSARSTDMTGGSGAGSYIGRAIKSLVVFAAIGIEIAHAIAHVLGVVDCLEDFRQDRNY